MTLVDELCPGAPTKEDTDQYAGQDADPLIWNPFVALFLLLAWLAGKVGAQGLAESFRYLSTCMPPHNYRQIHIMQSALPEGWNAVPRDGLGALVWFPKIPTCPKKWEDCVHYWNFTAAIGILLYDGVAFVKIHLFASLLTAGLSIAVAFGTVTPQHAITIILQHVFSVTTI